MNTKTAKAPTNASRTPKVEPEKTRCVFPLFDSINNAAGVLHCSVALIKAAKLKGCKAFTSNNRVDGAILIPFLFEMLASGSDLPEGFASWKEVLESEKAKREAIKRQQDEKSTMPTSDACRQAAEAMAAEYAEDVRMANELPPAIAGQDAVTIHKRLIGWVETKWKSIRAKYHAIGQ